MQITLTVRCLDGDGSGGGPFRYEFDRDLVLVGRDAATDVRLPHRAVSLVHLRLVRRDERLWALDPGSTNGTLLDGKPLPFGRRVPLAQGSRLRIGPFELEVGKGAPGQGGDPTAPTDTARFARQIVLEMMGGPADRVSPSLEVQNGPEQGRRLAIPLLSGPLVVGRGESCDLRLSDSDTSRRHLEVRHRGDAVVLHDLGSKNGVAVNGAPVEETRLLMDGDSVVLGNTVLLFADPVERELDALGEAEGAQGSSSPEQGPEQGPVDNGELARAEAGSAPPPRMSASWRPVDRLLFALVAVLVACAVAGVIYLVVV